MKPRNSTEDNYIVLQKLYWLSLQISRTFQDLYSLLKCHNKIKAHLAGKEAGNRAAVKLGLHFSVSIVI